MPASDNARPTKNPPIPAPSVATASPALSGLLDIVPNATPVPINNPNDARVVSSNPDMIPPILSITFLILPKSVAPVK